LNYWRLITAGVRYRPAPRPDDPVARVARETAARDREADISPATWPRNVRDHRLKDRRWMEIYRRTRWPEPARAGILAGRAAPDRARHARRRRCRRVPRAARRG
jgi:hypothetical protein